MKSLIYCLLILSATSYGQQLQAVAVTPLSADEFIGIDSYKNTYYVKDMVLHKSGPLGEFVFRNYQLGPMSSIDIINPLNVVVFYAEVNTAVLLDNRLNEVQRINFNDLPEFLNVSYATNAGNNRLWIFNMDTQQLELFNYRTGLRVVISQPIDSDVIQLASDFNYCYVLTSESIQKYNIWSSLITEVAVSEINSIDEQNGRLILNSNGSLSLLNLKDDRSENSLQQINLPLPENNIKDLQLTQDFLYIYNGLAVHTFSLTQPKQ